MPFNPKDVAEAETECYNCAYELAPLNGATFRCYLGQMLFCGKRFLKAAAENYHKVFCGKFFDDIYVAKGREGRDICFLLRLLAYWVRSGDHPLKIPLISWMTPPSLGRPRPFTLDRVVIEPIRILQGLEADIFDAKYDHWVLQTVRYDFRHSKCLSKLNNRLIKEIATLLIKTRRGLGTMMLYAAHTT